MAKPGHQGANLSDLGKTLLEHGPNKVLPTPRRVRVIHNHTFIVDTTKAVHVWEHDYYPQFYLPTAGLQNCTVRDKQEISKGGKGVAAVVEITIPGKDGVEEIKTDRALRFTEDKAAGELAGLIRLEFGSMDQWLEEDLPIYVHPKDPFKRVDILPSTRSIEVKVSGKTVAKSSSSFHLFETGLPARFYLPLGSVDQSCLRRSSLITQCPYKGNAEYYTVVIDGKETKDVAWYYQLPTHECAAIAGMVCFYNEKVDLILDGELLERPKTPFS